jgi:hypothetical protein
MMQLVAPAAFPEETPMPYRAIPHTDGRYALLAFDAEGNERRDDPEALEGLFSRRILQDLSSDGGTTDVFVFSHGWKGDMPAARDQYDRWFGALNARHADREVLKRRRPGFRPLHIGVHWPSLPWGDEEFGGPAGMSFAPGESPIELYAERLGERPGLREAIAVVVAAAAREPDAARLPPDAEQAYREIDRLLAEVGDKGAAAPPGDDREPFDPQAYFEAARQDASFGLSDFGGILAPLRQLSFWKMKQRARTVGEGGMHAFLRELQRASGNLRFHLMGHSFGCIVVSAMLCGPDGRGSGVAPVASLSLVQGALSIWSYCGDIPVEPGKPGYFRRLLQGRLVQGPTVTTRSQFDTAVGRFYPLGAGVARQVDFALRDFPRYGGLGAFGAQALDPEASDSEMLPADAVYDFKPGQVHNLEASRFIRKGDGASGAHSDIAGPEVVHVIWQAALPR